jgi:hypothetical protein
MKAVPGRKTDVKDAEWIAQLVEHGLVRRACLKRTVSHEELPLRTCLP